MCSITLFQESIPQVPLTFTPVFFWKTFRDASVSSPKWPSTVTPSTDCSTETATPEFPFRMIGSWVSNFPVRTTAFLKSVQDTLLFRSNHRWCSPVSTLSLHSQGSCMLNLALAVSPGLSCAIILVYRWRGGLSSDQLLEPVPVTFARIADGQFFAHTS